MKVSERLTAKLALLITLPKIEPLVPPLPSCKVPAVMVVGPLYVLLPVSTQVPAPIFVSPPVPEIVPENVVLVLSLPLVSVAEPSVTLPAPASEPMV